MPGILVFFILSATGEVYGTCWALWGNDVFGWNGLWIGLSLGAFGVCQSLAQAFLPGPAVKLLGERWAVLTGLAGAGVALVVMAFAQQAWMVFAIMPVFALAGIGTPALQSLATRLVDDSRQGQFQGVLASTVASHRSSGRLCSRPSTSRFGRNGQVRSGSRPWSSMRLRFPLCSACGFGPKGKGHEGSPVR